MKYVICLLGATFLLSSCANNGGIFDSGFWVKKAKDTKDVVVTEVVEVVNEVVKPSEPEKPKPLKKFNWDKDGLVCFTFDDNGEKVDCPDGV